MTRDSEPDPGAWKESNRSNPIRAARGVFSRAKLSGAGLGVVFEGNRWEAGGGCMVLVLELVLGRGGLDDRGVAFCVSHHGLPEDRKLDGGMC